MDYFPYDTQKDLAGVGIGFPGRVGILFSDPARVVIRPRAYIITPLFGV